MGQKPAVKGRSGGAAEQLLPPSDCYASAAAPVLHEAHQVGQTDPSGFRAEARAEDSHYSARTCPSAMLLVASVFVFDSFILQVSKMMIGYRAVGLLYPMSALSGWSHQCNGVCVQRGSSYFDLIDYFSQLRSFCCEC